MTIEVVLSCGARLTIPEASFVLDPYSHRGAFRILRACGWANDYWLMPVESWRVLP